MDGGLATASWDGTVRLWDTTRGANVVTFTHKGAVLAPIFERGKKCCVQGRIDTLRRERVCERVRVREREGETETEREREREGGREREGDTESKQ